MQGSGARQFPQSAGRMMQRLRPALGRHARLAISAVYAPPRPTVEQQPSAPSTSYTTQQQQPQWEAPAAPSTAPLSYELLQGNLVRFSPDAQRKGVQTAVLVHGILGSRKNLQSFAQMLTTAFPTWQVLLVDLRCHGESAAANGAASTEGPHTVDAAARDVLALLRLLKLFPNMLVGHSFGGKVIMSMVQQFGQTLPRPVQVWVLDTLPGQVRAGGGSNQSDHPADLISALQSMGPTVPNRSEVQDRLMSEGFSVPVARWMTTNLRNTSSGDGLRWGFDLDGIAQMYNSYEDTCLWHLLHQPPQGLRLDFVRAEGSNFRWSGADEDQIAGLGHRVHLLRDSGHWVHSDNPQGLFEIMAPSFGVAPDLSVQRAQQGTRRR